MTTEDLIEVYILEGIRSFKKLYRCTPEGHKLDRHESVIIQNQEFTCWREYTVFKMAEYIKQEIPDCDIEVLLDGNDTVITIDITETQQQKLNRLLYSFLKKYNKV